jgi:hypothetical protein
LHSSIDLKFSIGYDHLFIAGDRLIVPLPDLISGTGVYYWSQKLSTKNPSIILVPKTELWSILGSLQTSNGVIKELSGSN